MTGGKKKPIKARTQTKKTDFLKFEFVEIIDDIKRNWVDIKSMTKKITRFPTHDIGG
jgi:hypothetical protein